MTALAIFIRNRNIDLRVPDMDGLANANRADQEALFVSATIAPSDRTHFKTGN